MWQDEMLCLPACFFHAEPESGPVYFNGHKTVSVLLSFSQGFILAVTNDNFLLQAGSGAHPASYPVGTGGSSPGIKQLRHETTYLHLVLRSRMVELFFHSPIHLHGMVLN
jgi:hypothetical protein